MDDFTYSGFWWLPSDENNKLSGTLSFSSESHFYLELIGTFGDAVQGENIFHPGDSLYRAPIILGAVEGGERVTIENCIETRRNWASHGFQSQKFSPQIAYFGIHATQPGELRFHKVSAELTYLNDWVGKTGFTVHVKHTNDNGLEKYQIEYCRPDEITCVCGSNSLNITPSLHTKGSMLRGFSVQQLQNLSIESEKEISILHWIKDYLTPIQNLLTFATSKNNSVVKLVAYNKDHVVELPNGKKQKTPIEIYYKMGTKLVKPGRELLPDEMLFTLQDVDFNLGMVVKRWFEMYKRLKGIFDLYFMGQYQPDIFLENQFLSIMLAVEGYHRGAIDTNGKKKFKNEDMPISEYKEFKKIAIEKVPSQYEDLLTRKLMYNEVSLRSRVVELLDHTEEIVPKLLSSRKSFAKQVSAARNELVHQVSKRGQDKTSTEELYWMTQALIYTLQACFLADLGISISVCKDLFNRNQRYLSSVARINKHF